MNESLIINAKQAIGEDAPDDYAIRPTVFPSMLKESAPVLANLLNNARFKEIAARYEKHDKNATTAQSRFKKFTFQITVGLCIAAISGSGLAMVGAMVTPGGQSEAATKMGITFMGIVSTLGGMLAVFRMSQIKSLKLFEDWMRCRASAETERLGYFYAIAQKVSNGSDYSTEVQLQFLCMFKRYQLEVHRLFYESRCCDHKKSFETTCMIGGIAAIILMLGSGVMGIIGAFNFNFLPFAAGGTVGAAISTWASRREEYNQDERNVERYTRTADMISKLAEHYDSVLLLVSNGTSSVVLQFVTAVNDLLLLEHRQWTADLSSMPNALTNLEASIKELKTESPSPAQ